MARKSARKTRRNKAGKIVAQPSAFDRGTPEIQARRVAALGASANLLPLSADNPVDILTARGFLTAAQNQAARDYQRVHAIVYGASSARAAELDVRHGPGLSVRARLVAQRQLESWTRLVQRGERATVNAFSRYVIDGYCDAAIVEIVRATRTGGQHASPSLTLDQLARIFDLTAALDTLISAPRIVVSPDEVAYAECVEMLGVASADRLRDVRDRRRLPVVKLAEARRAA